ncbi:MAG: hypothetical protein A2Y63_00575 [Candidatus Riflebacteria bacterium RBG_13_59_9]|nr:MAG: hypothetical protein A2Y63_00575 [Candidatus Riflebacteria bacterium RBG_13_59_9]
MEQIGLTTAVPSLIALPFFQRLIRGTRGGVSVARRHLSAFWRKKTKRPFGAGPFGVILGVVFLLLCIGYVIGAYLLVGILAEISQKDYTPANERIASYERFFQTAEQHHLKVDRSPAYIKEGVKYFLWTITVSGRADKLVYRWQHNLQTNRVEPLTSPATYVDTELGYISMRDAPLYPYIAGDMIALRIAKGLDITPDVASDEEVEEVEEETEPETLDEQVEPAESGEETGEETQPEETEEAVPDEDTEEGSEGEEVGSGETSEEGDSATEEVPDEEENGQAENAPDEDDGDEEAAPPEEETPDEDDGDAVPID